MPEDSVAAEWRKTDSELQNDASLVNESLTSYVLRLTATVQGNPDGDLNPVTEYDLGTLLQEVGARVVHRSFRRVQRTES